MKIFNFGIILFLVTFVTQKEGQMVRRPAVAGQFYPANKVELQRQVEAHLEKAEISLKEGEVIGLVSPHAGYVYSGGVAAYAYKLLKDLKINTVILLGPSHQAPISGFAVYGKGKWQTPLGDVLIDEEIAEKIIKDCPFAQNLPEVHQYEHSLEVQLPFLQTTLKDFRIVPIMMLFPSFEECQSLAKTIARIIKRKEKKILFLASSDLYHGYSYDACVSTDKKTLSYIEKMDGKLFYDLLTKKELEACGGYPIVVAMLITKELSPNNKAKVLKYTNSNDVMGIKSGYCVGYGAVAFFSPEKIQKEEGRIELTADEKKELLNIARKTLENYLKTGKKIEFKPLTPKLAEKFGVFVTLKKRGELRGCIGYIEGLKPLYLAVAENTLNAALKDPRFPPVSEKELKEIKIEVTVLSPLKKISRIEEIEVGRHGLFIKKGYNQGLLLPQVATEHGWNREKFLQHTCLKAGLPPQSWRDKDTEIYIYEGLIISE